MFAIYGLIGLTLVIISFLLNIFQLIPTNLLSVNPLFVIGFWLFFDALDFKLNKTSILHKISKKHILFVHLILIGIFIGLFSDFIGIFLTDLWDWYYTGLPLWLQVLSYVKGLIFGYGFPILMYYSAYRVFLSVIRKEVKSFGKRITSKKFEKKLFSWFGVLSVVFLGLALVMYLFSFKFKGFLLAAFSTIGLFLILEYIEYKQHKRSFLKDIFEGRWRPIISVIITAVVIGFIWEYLNVKGLRWEYSNFPFISFTIFGVPLVVILSWIPFVILYLSFYRAVIRGKDEVW